MLNNSLQIKNEYMAQDRLSIIKLAIVRLFMVIGVWTVFFMLYSRTGATDLTLQVIILSLLAIYVVLELALMFYQISRPNKESQLISALLESKKG